MKYYSTRDAAVRMDAAEAIKMGLSRDGGLLTPCEIPQIDRSFLESLVHVRYQERAAKVRPALSTRRALAFALAALLLIATAAVLFVFILIINLCFSAVKRKADAT